MRYPCLPDQKLNFDLLSGLDPTHSSSIRSLLKSIDHIVILQNKKWHIISIKRKHKSYLLTKQSYKNLASLQVI